MSLSDLNLSFRQIKILLDVGQHLNITRAAQINYISQPYLSKMIIDLEKALQFDLFIRKRGALEMTHEGRIFYDYLYQLDDTYTRLKGEILHLQKEHLEKQTLTFGIPRATSSWFLHQLLPLYYQSHPNGKIVIEEGHSQQLLQKILDEECDIATVGSLAPVSGIEYVPVTQEQILVVSDRSCDFGHPEAVDNPLHPTLLSPQETKALNDQVILTYPQSLGIGYLSHQIMEELNIKPKQLMEVQSSDAGFQLAAGGFGITFIISSLAAICAKNSKKSACFFTLDTPSSNWTRYLCYKKGKTFSSYETDFFDLCKKIFREPPEYL